MDIKETTKKVINYVLPFMKETPVITPVNKQGLDPLAYSSTFYFTGAPTLAAPFNGEKTPGEMGVPIDYYLQYQWLRVRSWQSYLESEITQSVINKFGIWVIGQGLKLQSEPETDILNAEGITLDEDNFTDSVESRYRLDSKSRMSDYKLLNTLGTLQYDIHKNAIVGGDVLVILRTKKNKVNTQIVDGAHVESPYLENADVKAALEKKHTIKHGVELDTAGRQVAYYVRESIDKYVRVPRYGANSGRLMAFLVYGSRYRVDDVRGMPLIAAVLESLKKIDRYKEATVGSAEERQKIALFIQHTQGSTGENPYLKSIQNARGLGLPTAPETDGKDTTYTDATKMAASTNKQVFNLTPGAEMKMLESKNELYFKDFYDSNVAGVCAAIGIPFEVARSMYNSNYSASRAAIKDWEHNLKYHRGSFIEQFNQPHYDLWLDVNILNGKVSAPGYITAITDKNIDVINAYRGARFTGANVPHIDPLKEVLAERKKLGDDTTPLTTYSDATERLDAGSNFDKNMSKINKERTKIKKVPENANT